MCIRDSSLGGTMLLNAALASPGVLDGLFCASSPLDLAACSASIERPRNRVYQRWLLKRLVRQTLADPFGVSADEEAKLQATPPRSIREFDSAVTAPRWGFADVEAYYREASPLQQQGGRLSLIHISEPTRPLYISYAVFCLKKKN